LNRKTGIIIALVLALISTLAINVSANRKYATATKAVKAIQATQFIPAGETITSAMVKAVDVPERFAQGLATGDVAGVIGKSVKVSAWKGQYLMQDALDNQGRDPGFVEVFFPVTVPSSACVLPGEYVDVYQKASNNSPSALLCQKALVLHTVDSTAKQTEPGKSTGPTAAMGNSTVSAVGIEIPRAQAVQVVSAASQNEVYLVLSAV
jgi:Flp pilus assembly protein CpaB